MRPDRPGPPGPPAAHLAPGLGDVPETAGSVAVKRRSPLLPILALLVIAAVAVVAFVLFTGGDDSTSDDPVALVREYFDAVSNGECDAAVELIDTDGEPSEEDRGTMVDSCREAYDQQRETIEGAELASAELVSSGDDRATVRIEITEAGQEEPEEPRDVALIRIDGDWKIDFTAGSVATGEPAPDDGGGAGAP
jgi:hypothetical protein